MSAKAIAQRARLRALAFEAAANAPDINEQNTLVDEAEENAMSQDDQDDDSASEPDDFFLSAN